jgi:hypothetical protein
MAGALTTGCGGSSKPRTAIPVRSGPAAKTRSDASLTRGQLIAEAEPICKRLDAELSATENVKQSADPKLRMSEIARIDPGHAALEQKAADELDRLKPPRSLAHDWAQIVSYRHRLASELASLARAAAHKDMNAVNGLAKSKEATHALLRKLATRDGFKECADARAASIPSAGGAAASPRPS